LYISTNIFNNNNNLKIERVYRLAGYERLSSLHPSGLNELVYMMESLGIDQTMLATEEERVGSIGSGGR
jgi:hypothetical protein